MKKIFTLLSAILMALTSYAQLEITDEAGNVVADGATVEFNAEVLDLGGGFVIIDCAPAAPYITNKGDSSANLTVTVTRTETDKLSWCGINTTCSPMTNLQEVRSVSLGAGQKTALQLHADFTTGLYASYTANVTVSLGNETKRFTVKFVYADPNGSQGSKQDMPEDGKIYTIKFKHMNGAYTYLYWDSESDQLALGVLDDGQGLPKTANFTCRKVGEKYAFINSTGKYLTWRNNSGGGYNSNKGGTDTLNADYNLFTIEPISASSNVNADAAFLAGTWAIKGKRSNGSVGVFVTKAEGIFDGADVPFVTNTYPYYSSAAVFTEVQEAIDMPENGKAYTIKFKHMNGAYTYFYWDNANDQLTLGLLNDGEELPETAKFICRKVGNQFAFVNNAGKYLTWRNQGDDLAGYNGNKGGTDTFTADYNLFSLDRIATSFAHVSADAAFLSETLSITGKRGNGQVGVFVVQAEGSFYGADTPYVTNTSPYYSSAAIFTETTYPNTVTFKATDLTDGLNDFALATFSAPFASVLPEGVTAYSVTQDAANYTMLNVEALTGQALPANTGFILAGTADQTVTMVPATDETLVDATGTILQHSAGATKTLNQDGGFDFILGSKEGHVAFYRVNDAANELPMNRAYLHLAENPFSLGTLHMHFGGSTTTAIQGVQSGRQSQAPIYDLSGRRVQHHQKGGIYIQGGKKFIVR